MFTLSTRLCSPHLPRISLISRQKHQALSSYSEHELSQNIPTLDVWLSSKEEAHYSRQNISFRRLASLYQLIPTRGQDKWTSFSNLSLHPPKKGSPLPLGHHLATNPDVFNQSLVSHNGFPTWLRQDGSSSWHAPPIPKARKEIVGGSFIVSTRSPPFIGMNFVEKTIILDSKKRINIASRKHKSKEQRILVQTRQRLILSQWYPQRTDLVIEERITNFMFGQYNPRLKNTCNALPDATEKILSFSFTPAVWKLRAFAELCLDTHRIHYDRQHAFREGYPGIIAIFSAKELTKFFGINMYRDRPYMPRGLQCVGVDYVVVNPLFAEQHINVYRYWYDGHWGLLPLSLTDLLARTTHQYKMADDKTQHREPPLSESGRPQQGPIRRKGIKLRGLFWTEGDDGTVGTVIFVTLKEAIPDSFQSEMMWQPNVQEGYISRSDHARESITQRISLEARMLGENIVDKSEPLQRPKRSSFHHEIDSLDVGHSHQLWPSRHPWSQDDSASKTSEQADKRVHKSRLLLGQLFDHQDRKT